MAVQKNTIAHNSNLLYACLDIYNYPVWITDKYNNIIIKNSHAEYLFNSENLSELNHDQFCQLSGRMWLYLKTELNHDTGCFLNTLKEKDELHFRIEYSTNMLAIALKKRDAILSTKTTSTTI